MEVKQVIDKKAEYWKKKLIDLFIDNYNIKIFFIIFALAKLFVSRR